MPWIFLGAAILFIVASLIIWLVMGTTLFEPKYMTLEMPPPKTEAPSSLPSSEGKILTLILGENDNIYYYKGAPNPEIRPQQTDYSSAGIRSVVQEHTQSYQDPIVTIKPSEKSRYHNLVDILDEMAISEVKKYALTDMTPADSLLMENLEQDK